MRPEERLRDEIKKKKEKKLVELEEENDPIKKAEKDKWTAFGLAQIPTSETPWNLSKLPQRGKSAKEKITGMKSLSHIRDKSTGKGSPELSTVNKSTNARNQSSSKSKQDVKPKTALGKKNDPSLAVPANISEVYLHRVPLFARLKDNYESVAMSQEREKRSQIKDRMRRVEFEEIKQHSKRLETALKMREASKIKLIDDQKLSPELTKFMKEYKHGGIEVTQENEDKLKRRAEMSKFVKEHKGFEDKKVLSQLAHFKSQQNLFLREKEKLKGQINHQRDFIKNVLDPLRKVQAEKNRTSTSRIPTALAGSMDSKLPSVHENVKTLRLKGSASQVIMPRAPENHDEVKVFQTKLRHLEKYGEDALPYVSALEADIYGYVDPEQEARLLCREH